MQIRGNSQSGRFDSQHLQVVQREIARSVKPNLLRELEDKELNDAEFQRLLLEDLVDLSPEAKEALIQMRKEKRKKKGKSEQEKEPDFLSLLAGLEDFRRQVEEGLDEEPAGKPTPKPFFPPSIALSGPPVRPAALRPRSDTVADLNEAGQVARRMVAISPRPELSDQVARELQVFGHEILAPMKQFGIRIILLERHRTLTDVKIGNMHVVAPGEHTFDGRLWSGVRGLYDNSRRLLVVGEELVGLPNRSTARHEMAHAYDHFVSERSHRKLPLSVQLWNSFHKQRSGLVSDYAGTNPAEYFAESVEAFFQSGARDHLRAKDAQMFDYLDRLFN